MASILIIDAERARLKILDLCLQGAGHLVTCVTNEREASAASRKAEGYDVWIVGEILELSGLERLLNGVQVRPTLIRLLTLRSHLDIQRMLELTKGFDDHLESPLNVTQVQLTVDRALDRARRANPMAVFSFGRMVGSSPAMQQVLERVLKAAKNEEAVLLQGEFGVGKTLAAVQIHTHSRRGSQDLAVFRGEAMAGQDVAAQLLPPDGLMARLDGGSLYLQAVDRLPEPVQARLVELLDQGGVTSRAVSGRPNVRLFASLSRPFDVPLNQQRLIPELYYALGVNRIDIPPLRKRVLDIPELAHFFLKPTQVQIAGNAMEMLMNYDWPGNVAELRSILGAAANSCDDRRVEVKDLPPNLVQAAQRSGMRHRYLPPSMGGPDNPAEPA